MKLAKVSFVVLAHPDDVEVIEQELSDLFVHSETSLWKLSDESGTKIVEVEDENINDFFFFPFED